MSDCQLNMSKDRVRHRGFFDDCVRCALVRAIHVFGGISFRHEGFAMVMDHGRTQAGLKQSGESFLASLTNAETR